MFSLRQIEDIAVGIVHADAGEGAVARPMEHLDFRILVFKPGEDDLGVLDLEAEMIESGLPSRRARIQVQPDVTVVADDRAARSRYSPTVSCQKYRGKNHLHDRRCW